MNTKKDEDMTLIDRWAVVRMLSISESTLERLMVRDPNFPSPRRLGSRTIRWIKQEVEDYIKSLEKVDYFA